MLAHLQINSQKEQIAKMQSRLDNLTSVIAEMKARMDPLNKEVMERHVIGLCIEIVLILMLFIVFTKRNNNHNVPGTPRGSGHCMNGNGPPKLAIEDVHKDDVFHPAGKFCQNVIITCGYKIIVKLMFVGSINHHAKSEKPMFQVHCIVSEQIQLEHVHFKEALIILSKDLH